MSDDLVNKLLNLGPDDSGFREVGVAAAQALTEARAEIERLQERVFELKHGVKDQMEEAAYHKQKRDTAESELSTLRARVREVVGPFAEVVLPWGDIGSGMIDAKSVRAARQLNEDLK